MSPNNCDKCGHDRSMCECPKVEQVGGTHYSAVFQHWDWVATLDMNYFAANATKYVSRWRKKNGQQDLDKARSYIEKMISLGDILDSPMVWGGQNIISITEANVRFFEQAEMTDTEEEFCSLMSAWGETADLETALEILTEIASGQTSTEGSDHHLATPTHPTALEPSEPHFGGVAGAKTFGFAVGDRVLVTALCDETQLFSFAGKTGIILDIVLGVLLVDSHILTKFMIDGEWTEFTFDPEDLYLHRDTVAMESEE